MNSFKPKSLPQNVGGPVAVWKDVFTPKELDAWFASETTKWAEIAKAANLKAE